MRYLVLSDIHGNLEALDSVIADARRQGFDRSVLLGDIVGYGANPNEVLGRVRDLAPEAAVRGNHDKVVSGVTDGETFNDVARVAAIWTREALRQTGLDQLLSLPRGPLEVGDFLISHGSPLDEEEYILGEADAAHVFAQSSFDLAFFGHTHFACCFVWSGGRTRLRMTSGAADTLRLEPGARYLFNPGSIGQPRDHNPDASYAILDTEARTLQTRRVPYDVAGAQSAIEAAGLPLVLGQRLALGV